MFKSAETLRLAAEMRALDRVASPWREARTTWFDGTPESIEARLASTERVLTFARAGMTQAHMALEREAATARAELKEASHRLMVDFLDDGARAFKGSHRVAGWEDQLDQQYEEQERHRALPTHELLQMLQGDVDAGDTQGQTPAWDELLNNRSDPSREGYDPEAQEWLNRYRSSSRRVAGEPIVDLSSNGGDTGSSASMRHRDDRENNRYTIQRIPDSTGANTQRAITNHDDTEMMSADGVHHWASRRTANTVADFADELLF